MVNSILYGHAVSVAAAPSAQSGLGKRWICACRGAALAALALASPMFAAVCPSVGKPMFGAEPQILVDATCEDPGFNERNF